MPAFRGIDPAAIHRPRCPATSPVFVGHGDVLEVVERPALEAQDVVVSASKFVGKSGNRVRS